MARKFNLIRTKRPFPTIDWETAEKWLAEKRAIAAAKVLCSKDYAGICEVCGSEPGYKTHKTDGDIECTRCSAILAQAKVQVVADDMHRSEVVGTGSLNLVKPHDPDSQQLRDILDED